MEGLFRARIDDPLLQRLYDYWRSLFRDERLPSRADVNPAAIPAAMLPYVVLADVIDDGVRIRYRLVGTNMVDEWGQDFTGRYLDEIMSGSYHEFLESLFADVIAQRCAVFSQSAFRWDVGGSTRTRRLFMPLASEGGTVDVVLIGQTFDRSGEAGAPKKVLELLPGQVETFSVQVSPEPLIEP